MIPQKSARICSQTQMTKTDRYFQFPVCCICYRLELWPSEWLYNGNKHCLQMSYLVVDPCWALMAIWMAYLMPARWADYRHNKVLQRHAIHITQAYDGHLESCTALYDNVFHGESWYKCHAKNNLYMPLTMCFCFSVRQAIETLGGYI